MTTGAGFWRRPATTLIAACFLTSGILRVLDPASAVALEAQKLGAAKPAAEAELATAEPEAPETYRAMLTAIAERQSQLDDQTRRMAEKERVLDVAETRLRAQIKSLEEAEARLGALLRFADEAADKDIDKLVATFKTMDGKRAGPIFENMDVAFAAGLISRMDSESAANILGAVTPEQAYAITAHVASQNARAPIE